MTKNLTKLENLIISLITIIIRYHDSQNSVRSKLITNESNPEKLRLRSRELAGKLFDLEKNKLGAFLDKQIQEITTEYDLRKPFLNFLLYEICSLHSICKRTSAFTNEEQKEFITHITRLFNDFSTLLLTTKSTEYQIQFDLFGTHKEFVLTGFKLNPYNIYNIYDSNALTNSGSLLKAEIMEHFFKGNSDKQEIRELFAETLCKDHQELLLNSEKVNENMGLSVFNDKLIQELNAVKSQLKTKEEQNSDLKLELEKQQQQNSILKSELTQFQELKRLFAILQKKPQEAQLQKGADEKATKITENYSKNAMQFFINDFLKNDRKRDKDSSDKNNPGVSKQ